MAIDTLPKVMHGARAKVSVLDPATGQPKVIGMFSNVSYGVVYDVQIASILGRYSAAATEYTGVEPVNVTCSGFRVIGQGWHKVSRLPRVQDLLTAEYITLTLTDRQTDTVFATIRYCRPTSASGGVAAKQLSETTFSYIGLLTGDELGMNDEAPNASSLEDDDV